MSPLYPSGAVDAKAAAVYAGVEPETIRKWRQRGLLDPVGGTARYPMFALDDLDAAKAAAAAAAERTRFAAA
jgi:DNA-binding transcriptional MerR regulator